MTKASGCEVELSKEPLHDQEAFMSHANAALTPRARLRLAKLIVDDRWTPSTAAKMFMVCIAPGLMEAFNPGKDDESHGSTEEVQR